jgi:hypothetical protein
MLTRSVAAAAVALEFATAALAQPPPAIRSFDLTATQALGAAMYRQDSAAWVATDALRPRVPDFAAAHLKGWIVEDHALGQRVRFLRDAGTGLEAGYDIDVAPDLKAVVSEPSDRTLTDDEKANFAAIQTAADGVRGQPLCRAGYNHIVLKDPEHDGWLVWLLSPQPTVGSIPVGGHYRFSISKDGKTVVRRDALSASCLVMPAPNPPPGSRPVAVFVTHVVSPTPVETHVFLQLQSGHAMIVGAGGRMWAIENGHIRDAGPITAKPTP